LADIPHQLPGYAPQNFSQVCIFYFCTEKRVFIDYQWVCGKFCFSLLLKTAQKLRTSAQGEK